MNLTRRDALLSTALVAALSPSELAGAAPGSSMSHPTNDAVSRSATRVRGFADPEMDFQLLRSLGVANYMGASVGEVLAAGRNMLARWKWSRALTVCCFSNAERPSA